MKSLAGRDFLAVRDFSAGEIEAVLKLAGRLKRGGERSAGALEGKIFALYFEKPSLRTRVSFEAGILRLGGRAIYVNAESTHAARGEPLKDMARVLSRYVDGIIFRGFRHEDIEETALHADVPVINALSDLCHPCQALADAFTIFERKKKRKGLKIAYVGDGNNVAHSLIDVCAALGLEIALACPRGYEPDASVVKAARAAALETGGAISLHRAPRAAVKGADVVYTDVWVSMGQESETPARKNAFRGYGIDAGLLKLAAADAIFMHDLPAHRGEEVEPDVIDGGQSVVFDQAENRLYVQQAVLLMLAGKAG
ncbi:MAG: ornithine carbamoyltransferase [bacterium]